MNTPETRSSYFPILKTLKTYKKSWLRMDFVAGAAVAAVAVPQAMAYAELAGAPLIAGLYAALIAMLVFALFTTSRQVIVGPEAAMAALTGATVIPLAAGNASVAAALVAILAIMIGLACLIGMIARLGFLTEFLSRPILLGYMAGLAVTVIATQAPKLFGLVAPASSQLLGVIVFLISNIPSISVPTMTFSLIMIVLGIIVQKYFKRVPVSLVLLVVAVSSSMILKLSDLGIQTIGTIPTGIPIPSLPGVSLSDIENLVVPAIAIALVGYANTIATARSFAAKKYEHVDSPQEFMGLGFANMASGAFGGIPVSASGSRTAVNASSKAKTQVSQLFGALIILIVLIALAPLFKYLPVSALAVIIIMAVSKLFDYKELKSIWHAWRSEALLAIATLVGVVVLGILQGLLLAVILAIANLLRRSAIPTDAVLGVAEDGSIRDMSRPPKTEAVPGIIMYRFDAQLYFGNSNHFRDRVLQLIDESDEPVEWFLWDAETVSSIDSSSGQMLLGLIKELHAKDITFAIARMKGSVRSTVNKTNRLSRALQRCPHYPSIGMALGAYQDHPKDPHLDLEHPSKNHSAHTI